MVDTARLVHQAADLYRSAAEAQVRDTLRLRSVVGDDGNVIPEAALSITPVLSEHWYLAGAAATGTNVAGEYRLPQAATVVMIHARAKTPPSTAEYQAEAFANGVSIDNVTIGIGESDGTSVMNTSLSGGSVLTVNVITAGAAADLTISVYYRPNVG